MSGLPIAVDAMGGDSAPREIVAGAIQAVADGVDVILVGRSADVLAVPGGRDFPLIEASEVIAMDEDPAQGVRRKKDSSLVRAAEAVRDGKASAMVSAGNTGAAMASALLRIGRIRGVSRPAIATPIPVPGASPTILLDAGANAACQPEWLVQFAQMGSVYAQARYGVAKPNVGLMSIGEESTKGNALVKETHELLLSAPGVNFVGNVEGRDVMNADLDVVVTDGFTGNVVLKTLEGGVKAIVRTFQDVFASEPKFEAAAATLQPVLDPLYETLDPDTYGGAMLLGVNGVCIISHGSSNARAMVNAIRVAREMVGVGLVESLRLAITTP
jgi:glycerol-3-phosphate acyltransferase PlsX